MNEYLNLEETCNLLERTPTMIDIYVKKGLLTKYKILGKVAFKKSDVEHLLIPKPVSESFT